MTLARCSLNQATVRTATMPQAVEAALAAGIPAMGVWREPVAEFGCAASAALLRDAGLRASSLCRGGFVTMSEGPERREAIEDNRRAIDEAAEIGAATLALVVGGLPQGSRDLAGARKRVVDAVAELVPVARDRGVLLGLEPMHPMFASDRSVLSTLGEALDVAEQFPVGTVGVVVDSYHVWWDPDLYNQLQRARGRIAGYQINDWDTPLGAEPLMARRMPGDGVIDLAGLTRAVFDAGYTGDIEIEVFNQEVWDTPHTEVAREVARGYAELMATVLNG